MKSDEAPGSPDSRDVVSRVYTGGYEECRAALERDAVELAKEGYEVLTETYGVSWGGGICIGCLSVEFGRGARVNPRSREGSTEAAPT